MDELRQIERLAVAGIQAQAPILEHPGVQAAGVADGQGPGAVGVDAHKVAQGAFGLHLGERLVVDIGGVGDRAGAVDGAVGPGGVVIQVVEQAAILMGNSLASRI